MNEKCEHANGLAVCTFAKAFPGAVSQVSHSSVS